MEEGYHAFVVAVQESQCGRLIAATLVHELAHVNGAPGGMESKAAEATLPPCGFDDLFNPALVGMRVWRPLRIEIG